VTLFDLRKTLFRFSLVRALVGLFILARGLARMPFTPYAGITDLCWVQRVSGIPVLRRLAYGRITSYIFDPRRGRGRLMEAFLRSDAATRAANRIVKREAPFESMFRDIMVMKAPCRGEKGVIVLEYTTRFDLFVALFDYQRIIQDYYIVLEPCWAGYCDPSILMFANTGTDIIVQAPEARDFTFLSDLQCNLKPINLGSSDWIDAELFAPPAEDSYRPYDLIMVANWAKHKNHRKLFAALERVRHRPVSVMLIGIDWGGRTGQDILAEMREFDLSHVTVELKTGIPAREVAMYLGQSKAFLLLSEKEGSNRAIVEALFANTPAILYENFIGGAKGKVNAQTGLLASFENLAEAIDTMLDRHSEFTPRAWALEHTGSRNATAKLNAMLKSIAESRGERWDTPIVEKVNNPNFNYRNPGDLTPEQHAPAIARAYLRDDVRALIPAQEATR
jgi:glycosyltransferase involved in cell wall biosynthesis